MRLVAGALSLVLFCGADAGAQPAAPDARELLGRAAAYVKQFVGDFSNVVAEEDFRQDWQSGERRRLTSDFLLVRYPGRDGTFLAFRDVTAVNGRPVRDQQERLMSLFIEPFGDAVRRAEEITREASRHSLVELGALSSPLVILAWLQPEYQRQFTFRLGDVESNSGVRVRALELEQVVTPAANPGVARLPPLQGVAWIEEETGRVAKTEVRTGVAPNTTLIATTFAFDETLGINVPAEMRDSRLRPGAARQSRLGAQADRFTGIATYSRFRRFQVRTDETIDSGPAVSPR